MNDEVLREQLLALLGGGNSHMGLDSAVADFPPSHFNRRPPNLAYTPWHLLEHVRIAQDDVLVFIRDPNYVNPTWPDDYWPAPDAQAGVAEWQGTLAAIRAGLDEFRALVEDPDTDLTAPISHAPDYTILREVLVIADHNAYHIGEFAILRDIMDIWPATH